MSDANMIIGKLLSTRSN